MFIFILPIFLSRMGSKIMGGDGGGTGLVSPTSEVAQALDGEVEVSLAAITCGGGSGTKGQ
jgi:hypothetical protein